MAETNNTTTHMGEMGEPEVNKTTASEDEDWSEELYKEREEQPTTRGDEIQIDVSETLSKKQSSKRSLYAFSVLMFVALIAISTAFALTVEKKKQFERDLKLAVEKKTTLADEIKRLKEEIEEANMKIITCKAEADSKDEEIARWTKTFKFQEYQPPTAEENEPPFVYQSQTYTYLDYNQASFAEDNQNEDAKKKQVGETQYVQQIDEIEVPVQKIRHVPMISVTQKFVEIPQIEIVERHIEAPVQMITKVQEVIIPVMQRDDAELDRIQVEIPREIIVDVFIPIQQDEIVQVPKVIQQVREVAIPAPVPIEQVQIIEVPVIQKIDNKE